MAQLSFIAATKLIELIAAADPKKDMQVRVLTANQLAIGRDPLNPTSVIDLSKEAVRPTSGESRTVAKPVPVSALGSSPQRISRQSGKYLLEMKGKVVECKSLKELLAVGLKTIEATHPTMLDRLAQIRPRTKRIVGRDPADLFDQQDLADKYAERLCEGWWYGTNNSADETNTWLRRAAELAGLKWGVDISTSF